MSSEFIGITGPIAAGKDTVADYLSNRLDGMPIFHISDELKTIARQNGLALTRENLVAIGTEVANRHGDEFLAQRILERTRSGIIVGLRRVGQLALLGSQSNFQLCSVDADPVKRFVRVGLRGKPGEAETFEEFTEDELRENSPPNIQRVRECMERADYHISNNGTLEELHGTLDKLLFAKLQ